jgi:polyferredoxin
VAQDRNPPFMLMSDGSVRNAFTVKLRNMESRPRQMRVAIEGLPGGMMWTDTMARENAERTLVQTVPADSTDSLRVYVVAPSGTPGQMFALTVTSLDEEAATDVSEVRFAAPEE